MKFARLLFLVLLVALLTAPMVQANDHFMIRRGDVMITDEEFDARMSKIPAEDRAPFLADKKRLNDLLAFMLLRKQLAAEARTNGFDDDPLVQARMRLAAEQELSEAWLEHYVDEAPDADYAAMAREYWAKNGEQYVTEPSLDVTHLLVSTKERSDEEARARAEELLEQVRANPAGFDELVMAHSEDPSVSSNRGHFENVKRGMMVRPFEQAAFQLEEPGQISDLIKSPYGYHIVRLDQRHEARQLGFEEARPQIEERMRRQHRERLRNDYLAQFANQPVELREGALEEMVERYFGAFGTPATPTQ